MTDDDYITIRIPRCRGWRTVALNAGLAIGALTLCRSDVAAAVCAVALINIALRLASRVPVKSAVYGLMRPPGDVQIMAALASQADSVRPVHLDAPQQLTEMIDVMLPPGLSVQAALEVDKRQTRYALAS